MTKQDVLKLIPTCKSRRELYRLWLIWVRVSNDDLTFKLNLSDEQLKWFQGE